MSVKAAVGGAGPQDDIDFSAFLREGVPMAQPPPIADVIVVLGCRVSASGGLSPAGLRRAREAARAYHRGLAPRVIASGGRRWGHLAEARALEAELVRAGVPRERIKTELCSLTTWENARYTKELLAREGRAGQLGQGEPGPPERIALVTCAWHMPRAIRNFEAVGLDSVPVPAEPGPTTWVSALSRRVHEVVSSLLDTRLRHPREGGRP